MWDDELFIKAGQAKPPDGPGAVGQIPQEQNLSKYRITFENDYSPDVPVMLTLGFWDS